MLDLPHSRERECATLANPRSANARPSPTPEGERPTLC